MIRVKIEQSGLNIHVFAEQLKTELVQEIVSEAADYAYETMRQLAPRRTGRLQASIEKRVGEYEATVGPTVPYAVYVEYGTLPHEIRPVHAQALRFEVAGEIVFAKRVLHPGSAPQPFVRNTLDEVVVKLPSIISRVMEKAEKG